MKNQPTYSTMQQLINLNFPKVHCRVGSYEGKCLFMNGPKKDIEEACKFAFERGDYTINSCPTF